MRQIHLKGSWIIKAPRTKVYEIMSDFENFPKYFPTVAQSFRIIEKQGNSLKIKAIAKSFGTTFPVDMKTLLKPPAGFISDNKNDKLGIFGHEEFILEEVSNGTRVNYIYNVTINRIWLRLIAKPLLGWFSMWFWKRAVIDKLKRMLEQ